jgi:hypothetical protein
MKFFLRTALAAITLVGIGLGMYVEHGLLGIGLLLPPAILIGVASFLWRKGWRATSIGCLVAYLIVWSATEFWGTASFQTKAENHLRGIGPEELGPFQRLSYDPMVDRTRPGVPAPWYYLSHPHSPCPLVVYADAGWCAGEMRGGGGRSYALWCGDWLPLASKFYWSS